MQRRYLLLTAPLVPFALLARRFFGASTRRALSPDDLLHQALQLDQFASNIHTPEDARRLVDFVAGIFTDDLSPAWTTRSLRNLTTGAEYLAVTNPDQRIPEQRVAKTWNAFVATMGAPESSRVNTAEIHNLRDGLLTSARVSWNLGQRNIWAVPSVYATQPDGSLAPGCRAIESVRILWDLANMPDNLQGARERVQKGLLVSDQFRDQLDKPPGSFVSSVHAEVRVSSDPVRLAMNRFIKTNGANTFRNAVTTMLNSLLSAGN